MLLGCRTSRDHGIQVLSLFLGSGKISIVLLNGTPETMYPFAPTLKRIVGMRGGMFPLRASNAEFNRGAILGTSKGTFWHSSTDQPSSELRVLNADALCLITHEEGLVVYQTKTQQLLGEPGKSV